MPVDMILKMIREYPSSASRAEARPLLMATSRMIRMIPPGLLPRGQRRQEKHWEHSQMSSCICW
ncbi:hypothetical protein D3C83_109890 [compost metagenome]